MSFEQFLFILLAYLCGAVPYGYLLTKKFTGLNILEKGSGNTGSTNVRRIAGRQVSLLVQVLDILKGFVPVAVVLLRSGNYADSLHDYFIYLVAISTILGHNFSVFLRFKGGKGVNTTLGATFLLAPFELFCSVLVYFLVKWKFRYVSAGSMALSITMPLVALLLRRDNSIIIYLTICCLLILFRHYSNMKRLVSGSENL